MQGSWSVVTFLSRATFRRSVERRASSQSACSSVGVSR
jgi:hypothetical protein